LEVGKSCDKARSRLLVAVLIFLFIAPPTEAQQIAKSNRIGVMAVVPTPSLLEAWRKGLRERGWVEGQNVVVEYRYSLGNDALFVDFAAEFVRLKVDVIGAVSDPAVRAAKQATSTIPIVMAAGTASAFVTNLARPDANITGFSIFAADLAGKQLQLLKEAVGRVSRVAVLHSTDESGLKTLGAARIAGLPLGLMLEPLAVDTPGDIDRALVTLARRRPDAILVLPSTSAYAAMRAVIEFAAANHLPTMYPYREAVDAGGLIAYTTMLPELFQRVASYVDKILKGAKPAALPVEQPNKFELSINLKTAKALGLTIPPSLLARADQVTE
jgi:putative ABC transport system substrate-binding protein